MRVLILLCSLLISVQCNAVGRSQILKDLSCRKSDLEFEKCILSGIRKLLPVWINGIPEIGIPPLDPLHIPKITVNQTVTDISATSLFTDTEIIGLKNIAINSLKFDPDNLYGSIKLSVPSIHIETDYWLKGQFYGVPIEHSGHSMGDFTDITLFMKATLKPYTKEDGLEYLKTNKFQQDLKIGSGQIKIDVNEKEYQFTVNMMSQVFNRYPERFLNIATPIVSEAIAPMTQKLLDAILSYIPTFDLIQD